MMTETIIIIMIMIMIIIISLLCKKAAQKYNTHTQYV